MITVFALLCQVCGLSHREAANFFNVRLDTVKSWSSGRRSWPDNVITELVNLADHIDAAADEVVATMVVTRDQDGTPDTIELGIATDDHEAQSLGWPCVGVHRAAVALTIARGMVEGFSIVVVPYDTTVTTVTKTHITAEIRDEA